MNSLLRTLSIATLAIAQASCGGGSGNTAGSASSATAQASTPAGGTTPTAPTGGLTALSPIAGVPAWSMTGGNAGHSNYVPAAFDPARFSRRFSWTLPAGTSVSQAHVALDSGQAFAVMQDAAGAWSLHAMNEATGRENWVAQLGKLDLADPPATYDGKVVLSTQAGVEGDALLFFDQATGALLDKRTIPSRHMPGYASHDMRKAPVIADGGIYVNERAAGRLIAKFDAVTHDLLWESEWTDAVVYNFAPMADKGRVYVSLSDGGLAGFDAVTGSRVVDHHREFNDAPMDGIVADGTAYGLSAGGVVATGLAKGDFKWQGPALLEMAAPPGPVLYGVAAGEIQAIDAATGKPVWSMPTPGPTSVSNPILVTRNLLFVSGYPQTSAGTYAIDLATRKVVWSTPEGGWLSISPNGVLYITPFSGQITAVNLK